MARMIDRFYPIFDSADWFARMLPLGVKFAQLRVKDRPEEEIRAEIRESLDLCAEHGATLVINDHWQMAIEEEAEFVHLGQEDLDEADVGAIRDAGLKLGISSHDHIELDRALALEPDYIALGPVYPTILKKMRWHQQGLERVTEWKEAIGDIPLCAIGGMRVERQHLVFGAGADIISVVTDITLNKDPEARVREWVAATTTFATEDY
ncbi:thiamine phosphate synthase [Amaricoccus macauensis]|uniref:thiamine phosphate synthase n=1 Tax=Amaricoccus macauensis TaxID=57001 RepID=UPI003C79F38D